MSDESSDPDDSSEVKSLSLFSGICVGISVGEWDGMSVGISIGVSDGVSVGISVGNVLEEM